MEGPQGLDKQFIHLASQRALFGAVDKESSVMFYSFLWNDPKGL